MADLHPDEVDALLRDPNTPGDVRQAVAQQHAVDTYLNTVEFVDASDGTLSVQPKPPTSDTPTPAKDADGDDDNPPA